MSFVASRLGDEGAATVRAVEKPTMRDIGWVAALYEGEGTAAKNGKSSTTVQMKQKDPWVLERTQRLFGGNLVQRTYVRAGYGRDRDVTLWYWTVHGPRARGFLMTIYPLLSPRRQTQARRALGLF